jgi:uncharacterized OB-fold protein
LIAGFLNSCSKSISFNKSVAVPSAIGSVKLTKGENNNRMMIMKVENLVEPSRLTPAKKVYVVWEETKKDGVKNLGKIVSSEAVFPLKGTRNSAQF